MEDIEAIEIICLFKRVGRVQSLELELGRPFFLKNQALEREILETNEVPTTSQYAYLVTRVSTGRYRIIPRHCRGAACYLLSLPVVLSCILDPWRDDVQDLLKEYRSHPFLTAA